MIVVSQATAPHRVEARVRNVYRILLLALGVALLASDSISAPVHDFDQYLKLVEVHAPNGQIIYVNPREVTSIREPLAANRRYLAKGVNCVMFIVNGNFIGTIETCPEIRKALERP